MLKYANKLNGENKMKLLSIEMIFILLLTTGCSVKDYQLFKNDNLENMNKTEIQDINISYESKILPDDILSIDIYNMNQKSNILRDSTLLGTVSSEPKNRYVVESDGTIYLPLLKEVKVGGLTTQQLNKKLTQSYSRYLKQPYVKTSVKNHKVYILGEVRKVGVIPIEGNSISLIEAISKAGGFTDYAMRNRVRIISKNSGKYTLRTLDLTKFNTLNIDNLILKPNSIIYVEPRSAKAIKVGINDYLPMLQAISSLASTYLAVDYVINGR